MEPLWILVHPVGNGKPTEDGEAKDEEKGNGANLEKFWKAHWFLAQDNSGPGPLFMLSPALPSSNPAHSLRPNLQLQLQIGNSPPRVPVLSRSVIW